MLSWLNKINYWYMKICNIFTCSKNRNKPVKYHCKYKLKSSIQYCSVKEGKIMETSYYEYSYKIL